MRPIATFTACLAAAALVAGVTAIAADGNDPSPSSQRGELSSSEPTTGIANPAQVVEFWRGRAEANPTGFLDRTQLGLALTAQARADGALDLYESAESELRAALAVEPNYAAAQLGLGQALHAQHRFDEARGQAEAVLAGQPSAPGALALAGDASLELGDYGGADEFYARLAADDRSAPVVSRLSRLAYWTGDPQRSLELAEEALALSEKLALNPTDAAFYHFQLGHVLFTTGDVDGAILALETALQLAPGSPAASEELAFVYASADRSDEAEALYAELVERTPAADLHAAYADLLSARGATAEADAQLAAATSLAARTADRYPAERRHLVGFYLTIDPDRAVALAEADLASRADVGAYDTLAWALYHAGRHAEAADAAARVVESGVRDAAMLYHAGAIAAANGNDARAAELVADALSINDRFHPREAEDARLLLDQLTSGRS